MDSRLIDQFMERLSGNTEAEEAAKKQKLKKRKREEEEEDKKKKKKAPSFLMQTASGRMPKMADRFEASSNKATANSQQSKNSVRVKEEEPEEEEEQEEEEEEEKRKRGLLPNTPSFEKSVRALERDLRMLPATAAGTIHPASLTVASRKTKSEDEVKIKVEERGGGNEEEEEEEDEEDSYELTEWFPPSDSWSYLQKVIVTDVTVDDVTVTMRECKTPEGFFTSPVV